MPRERERPGRHTGAARNSTNTTVSVSARPLRPPVQRIYEVEVVLANGQTRRELYYSLRAAQRAVERHQERGRNARLTTRRFVEMPPRSQTVEAPGHVQDQDHEAWADVVLKGVLMTALAHRLFALERDQDLGDGDLGQAAAHLFDHRDLLELATRKGLWLR